MSSDPNGAVSVEPCDTEYRLPRLEAVRTPWFVDGSVVRGPWSVVRGPWSVVWSVVRGPSSELLQCSAASRPARHGLKAVSLSVSCGRAGQGLRH